MKEYPKIMTVFERHREGPNKGVIIPGAYAHPEFAWLEECEWDMYEKVDGTNIRVIITPGGVEFKGRTDRAQLHPGLLARLGDLFPQDTWSRLRVHPDDDSPVTLYGEGIGGKIQSPMGMRYMGEKDKYDFILFDVRVGEWWLQQEQVCNIGEELQCRTAPYYGSTTLDGACALVEEGIESVIAREAGTLAEGVILRSPHDLRLRNGQRIIAKLKTKDFRQLAKSLV